MDNVIRVENVNKTFKLPHEKNTSIKSAVINFYRHKKTYEMQHALKNISFEVNRGDFFGIVGRNGSGKSTMLKLLAGIYSPTKGEIHIGGSLTPFIELGVGFNPELTGRENVFLNGALLGFTRGEMQAMYKDIVDFAEIDKFMDQKLKNYSSGMQVRLAFSIAIRARSDILLLDEVLAVGDAAFQQKCFNYFEELKRQHQTVVFVSHDMGAIRRFCNRAVYIKEGKLVHEGTPTEVADIYMADNIEHKPAEDDEKTDDLFGGHKLTAKISNQAEDSLALKFAYESNDKKEMYIGLSLIKEGVSVGEITTPLDSPIKGRGTVSYTLNIRDLNAGVYHIDSVLSRVDGQQLVSIGNRVRFTIKGGDNTRGAALKLPDSWEYK